ncbi:clostripain-related cysteine peptidase [bacterium]|nr:clostripain-related cysteine peptidase [bacterium]
MAYSYILDEKYGGGLLAVSAGYYDTADSLYDPTKVMGQLVEDEFAYGELTEAWAVLGKDKDFYDFGQLSTGVYSVDVDDFSWDGFVFDGNVSSFSVYNNFGQSVETQYSTFSDIEFTVESAANYYLGIEGPLFNDAQYSVTYSKVSELNTVVNYPAIFSNPVFDGELKSGAEITLGVEAIDLNLYDPNGLILWGLYTGVNDFNPVATSTTSSFLLDEELVGQDLYFRAGFFDLDGFAELSDAFLLGTVLAGNSTPILTTQTTLEITEDTSSAAISVSATDADADGLNFSFSNPAKGSVLDNGNGTYTFTPNANQNGSDSFTVTVSDGTVDVDQTVSVTIAAINDLPILTTLSAISMDEDTNSNAIAFSATDVDDDNLTFGFGNPSKGSVTDNGNGTYTYTPNSNENGNDSFTVTVNDGTASVSQEVSVTINPEINPSADGLVEVTDDPDILEDSEDDDNDNASASENNIISYTLPTQIDLSNGDTWATIAASSPLDIDDVIFRFDERILYGSSTYGHDFVGVWGYGDDWDDGRSGRTLEISGDNSVGSVTLEQIEITEINGTETIITQAELEARGLQTSFEFVNDATVTPKLPTSDFDPANLAYTFDQVINIGSIGGDFGITASADHISDIEQVVFWLDTEIQRDTGSSYSFFGLYGYSDSWGDGTSSQTFALTQFNDSGTVDIQEVEVRTSSGVDYIYYEHDLASLGLQTSFRITSENDSYTATDITEPNDSFANAYDVNSKSSASLDSALTSLSGLNISSALDLDFYLIEVADGETFTVDLTFGTGAGDLDLEIYDQQRLYIDGSYFGVNKESLTISEPGTYYLAAYGFDGAEGNYSLSASAFSGIAEDIYEDNDTLATAYDFGVQNTSVSGYFTDLTIDKAYDDDYFAFTIDTAADLDITIAFDHDKGDLDVELLDSSGNWLAGSSTVADEETISVKELAAGDYYFTVYGYEGATSPNYSVTSTLTLDPLPDNADAYERNDSFETAYGLGSISAAQTAVTSSNFHSSSDEDFYSFSLNGSQSLGIEAVFAHSDGDLDIELLDSNGNWIDASTTGSDNEYLSLSGLAAGTYTLNAYGYDGATVDNYSVRFIEESFENWWDTYDNWWDWQEADQASNISADSYEDNDTFATATDLGSISTSTDYNNLTVDSSGDDDWFKFNYDASTRLDVRIGFDGTAADLDMDLYDANWNWIDGSYGVEGSEEVSLVGLASGEYYLSIYEYNYGTVADYDLNLEVTAGAAIADLNDQYEPNDSFADATDMGDATGEGSVTELTLTSGDVDWYKAYFPNNGTPDQYISALFDHQDGDIDIELYDSSGNLIRSSESSTDNEMIYLSDIAGGYYYYLKVYPYGENNFQEYSLDYSFPVEVSTATISADSLEGNSGNEIFSAASTVGLVSQTHDLTIHSTTDTDCFSFTTRNLSSSSSEISISYDAALGAMNLSLWAVDVGQSAPTLVAATASGTGREVISFDNYLAGTYYLQAFGPDGALIPDYSLSMDVTELEGGGSQSNVIPADQFDRASSNDTSATATDLGTLSTTLNVADLSIHSSTDKDFLQFATTYAGETQITLSFSHEGGDIDTSLKDSGGTEIAYAMSGDDNETLTFQSSIDESYTLEVYGYDGDMSRDYDLSIAPKQLNSRRDDYESNDDASSAVAVRDTRASFDNLTLHNASDQDWFKFTIAETAGSSNAVQVTSLLGADAELKIYSSDGTTQVGSTVSITDGSGSVDTSGFASGDYYAVVSSTASSEAAASAQLSNYNLYVDQVDGAASATNASWTVMVYIDGDNNLASAAVDDINEMEGVVLPENVNVVTLTDLSGDYDTSAGWTDTRQGEISPDPNGYSWYGDAATIVSDLTSLGELNTGDPTTLTNFIDWSTTNHAADNYALVLWDHGGGLSGIAWDDTDNHDNLSMSDIKSAIDNSSAFSSTNKLDLIGFDACLMQTYELGLEMASLADVMVASQELEPGDGWDYQAFLQSLADNPYASAKTLGGYIVDSYDAWYNSSAETLSSVDLSKFQAIDDAIATFNSAAQSVSGSEWLIMDDAAENAWSSARHSYGRMGEDRDLGQFFEYIFENSSDNTLKTAAASVKTAIDAAVITNSSHQDLSGIQGGLLESDASIWSGTGLIGKNGSAWGQFQQLYDFADRSVSSASAENLTPDYSETSDALGRSSQGNNTSLTAFEIGTVTNATLVDNLTIHNAQDVDWYSFATPGGLDASGNALKVNATNTAPIKVALYDGNRELIAQREGLESSFDLTEGSDYFIKVETSTGRQDIAYKLDVDLVAADTSQEIIVADLAEGSSSNDVVAKATELTFNTESNTTFSNLGLSLTNGDQDWFEISAGRLSEQSPNLFSVVLDESDLTNKEDVVIELADASGTVLATSTAIGGNETVIFEDYTSDIFINVKSGSGKVLDYKLDLRHADYDVDGSGSVSSATDGEAILASLFSNTTTSEVAGNLFEDASAGATSLQSFMSDYTTTLLDVDGDGVTKASTDGVIIDAYIAGASADLLLPLISSDSPITTSDELLTHLLEIA